MAEKRRGRSGIPWRIVGWGAAALVLLHPLVAMRFTDDVNWDAADFVLLGALLGGGGLVLELALRRSGDAAYRTAAGVALAAAVFLVWINGAVGVIGSEREDANTLYGGVLAVGLLGAIVARFRPAGMARAMVATALAQASVPPIAAALWPDVTAVRSAEVLALTGLFAATWLLSAWLFRKAAA